MRMTERFSHTASEMLRALLGKAAALTAVGVAILIALTGMGIARPTPAKAAGAPIIFGLGDPTDGQRLATEAGLNKRAGIVGSFATRTNSPTFWGSWARSVRTGGAVLQLFWDPTYNRPNDPHSTLRSVLAGEHDDYIRSWTRQVAEYGHPVIIRLWAEMNGNWQPYSPGINGNTTAEFAPAWQHVVNLARSQGATNILWDWNPDKPFTGATPLSSLWPGGSYVDWVGLDVYNFANAAHGAWQSFSAMMGPAVAAVRAVAGTKPLMLNEVGCNNVTGQSKADWLTAMYASLPTFGVRAVVYFDYAMDGADWRLSQPGTAMAAASAAVHTAPLAGANDLGVDQIERLLARQTSLTPVADYTGDGASDTATWRQSNGTWNVPGQAQVSWGQAGDLPAAADFSGGGKSDMALFRPSTGDWWIRGSATTNWGLPGDIPVPADYNGDGKADISLWRPSNGRWYPRNGASAHWGLPGDVPVPGDYNGDGRADTVIYRPSTNTWWVPGQSPIRWGEAGDIPVPADYNGDGKTDLAVWRPSTGTWWVLGQSTVRLGQSGDVPVPGDYNGDGQADETIYRPFSGTWSVAGGATTHWGMSGDAPVALPQSITAFLRLQ